MRSRTKTAMLENLFPSLSPEEKLVRKYERPRHEPTVAQAGRRRRRRRSKGLMTILFFSLRIIPTKPLRRLYRPTFQAGPVNGLGGEWDEASWRESHICQWRECGRNVHVSLSLRTNLLPFPSQSLTFTPDSHAAKFSLPSHSRPARRIQRR